jgi:hypothetical protein
MVPFKIKSSEAKTPIFFRFSPDILEHGKKMIEIEMIENNEAISIMEAPLVGPIN